jgi:hypothetical protein
VDYQKIYNDLIDKARTEGRSKGGEIYYEAHHIVPRCLGGEGEARQWRTHPNIILLTAEEHFYAHYYLTKIYPDNSKLLFALWGMCYWGRIKYCTIEQHASIYQDVRSKVSEEWSMRMLGRVLPAEVVHKRQATRLKNGSTGKGKPKSEEHRAKLSAALLGRTRPPELVAKARNTRAERGTGLRSISQHTLDGTWIRDWSYSLEASKALDIPGYNITNCCRGRQKTAGGYIWRYKS